MDGISIRTQRMLLRRWNDTDLPALTTMNQDPAVMEFIGPTLNEAESQSMIDRAERSWMTSVMDVSRSRSSKLGN